MNVDIDDNVIDDVIDTAVVDVDIIDIVDASIADVDIVDFVVEENRNK